MKIAIIGQQDFSFGPAFGPAFGLDLLTQVTLY